MKKTFSVFNTRKNVADAKVQESRYKMSNILLSYDEIALVDNSEYHPDRCRNGGAYREESIFERKQRSTRERWVYRRSTSCTMVEDDKGVPVTDSDVFWRCVGFMSEIDRPVYEHNISYIYARRQRGKKIDEVWVYINPYGDTQVYDR